MRYAAEAGIFIPTRTSARKLQKSQRRVDGDLDQAFLALRLETDLHRRQNAVDAVNVVGPGSRHQFGDIIRHFQKERT